MRLAALALRNWRCFRGEQSLDLQAKVYGVVARHEGDPERSNWLGKTSLPAGVVFALTGRHDHEREDDWITRGEAEGGVTLTFDTGAVVARTRRRGKSTRLRFVDGHGREYASDEAQRAVHEYIGLSERDLLATSVFEQGEMASLLTAQPSARMAVFSEWLRLGALEVAVDGATARLASLTWDAEQVFRAREAAVALRAQVAGDEDLDAQRAALARSLEALREKLKAATDDHAQNERVRAARRLKAESDEARREIEQIEALLGDPYMLQGVAERATERVSDLTQKYGVAHRDVVAKESVARGEFDGTCPLAGIECPATKKINAATRQGRANLLASREVEEKYRTELSAATHRQSEAEAMVREDARRRERVSALGLRTTPIPEATALAALPLRDPDALRTRVDTASRAVQDAAAKLASLDRGREVVAKASAEVAKLDERAAALERRRSHARAALAVLQRSHTLIAQGGLVAVEADANAMLVECAIPLTLGLQWAREGRDPAKACSECGHPFPASARVKECERCRSPRGKHMVQRLDVALSDWSGGARDLAGAAMRLSAAAWLRRQRGARWGVALLDEPFGQLDARFRRSLGTHLATVLRSRYGFEQALVIAHHSSVLDALPGRIEVVATDRGSTARVAA